MKYKIKLDQKKQSETNDELVAWVNYRSIVRRADLPADTHIATLEHNGEVLHEATVGGKSLDLKIGDNVAANDLLKLLMQKYQLSLSDLKLLVKKSGLIVSNSKITGWLLDKDKRKYQKMYLDELFILIDMIEKPEMGYTPANYRNLIAKTGLSNADFIRKFDLNESTFYANIADIEHPRHVSMSYKSWLGLIKKVESI